MPSRNLRIFLQKSGILIDLTCMNPQPYSHFFFDLQKAVTTDASFNAKCTQKLKLMSLAEKEGRLADMQREMTELLRLCDYNASLLIPYFFPKFNKGMYPMSLWSRPHSIAMMSLVPNGSVTLCSSRQIGKCVTGDTEVEIKEHGSEKIKKCSLQELFAEAKSHAGSH